MTVGAISTFPVFFKLCSLLFGKTVEITVSRHLIQRDRDALTVLQNAQDEASLLRTYGQKADSVSTIEKTAGPAPQF